MLLLKVGIEVRFLLGVYTLSTYSDVVSLLLANHKYDIYIYVVRAEIFQEIKYFALN